MRLKNILINAVLLIITAAFAVIICIVCGDPLSNLGATLCLFNSVVSAAAVFWLAYEIFKPESLNLMLCAAGALAVGLIASYFQLSTIDDGIYIAAAKVICFGSAGLLLFRLAYSLLLKKGHAVIYWILGGLSACALTAGAIVLNSYWHFLSFNALFSEPVSVWAEEYALFIEQDITYNIGIIASLRYPAVFIFVIALFAVGFAIQKKRVCKSNSDDS